MLCFCSFKIVASIILLINVYDNSSSTRKYEKPSPLSISLTRLRRLSKPRVVVRRLFVEMKRSIKPPHFLVHCNSFCTDRNRLRYDILVVVNQKNTSAAQLALC